MRKLGRVQQHTLSALRRRGSWAPADPWRFGSRSDMERCMASLVQSGHVRIEGGRYYPNQSEDRDEHQEQRALAAPAPGKPAP